MKNKLDLSLATMEKPTSSMIHRCSCTGLRICYALFCLFLCRPSEPVAHRFHGTSAGLFSGLFVAVWLGPKVAVKLPQGST